MADLHVPQHIFNELVALAKRAAPIEACGILAGHDSHVSSFYQMANADNSPDHFTLAPADQFAVAKKIRRAGEQMLAICHSHPASPARPSAEDIRLALTPGVVYVILSLASTGAPVLKGFRIEDGAVTEVPVRVADTAESLALRLPDSVRQDALEYRSCVEKFIAGETSTVAFKAYRVPMGVYEQRTAGHYMVRVRVAAGVALPGQLRAIARLSKMYGNGVLHVTTRQDIQIHDVLIENTPAVMEGLLEAGLSSRGGGGNTVRNISASVSGSCPGEIFNVAPYAVALAEYALQHKNSFNLPRKYKIAFSGCDDDCGQASVADLGFFAQIRDGRRGFRVFAGGGMGREPRPGILMEEFVEPEDIFEITEAVRRLFDQHGDRLNKNKARLRFVVGRLGEDVFRRLYFQERAAIQEQGLPGVKPVIRTAGAENENTHSVRVPLALGDIAADDLLLVADVADHDGGGIVLTTQLQDLVISGVPEIKVARANEKLRHLKKHALAPTMAVCAGAATCKLGMCLSRNLAGAIAEAFKGRSLAFKDTSQVVRISGCPNGCGGHQAAGIGLEGGARRVNGRLMPVYSIFTGGRLSSDGATLARKIATVPAKRVPSMLVEALVDGRIDPQWLQRLAPAYEELRGQIPYDYFFDFDAAEPFSLAGRGPGECGAGVMDIIRVDLQEARDSLAAGSEEELYRALVAAARSLLVLFGVEAKKDRDVFDEFERNLIAPGWVSRSARRLVSAALDSRLGGGASIAGLRNQIDALVLRVDTLFLSLDADLKFRAKPLSEGGPAGGNGGNGKTSHELDLSGVACPINFVKAKVALEKIPLGGTLDILLDDGEPIRNVPESFADQGQEVVGIEPVYGGENGLRHMLRIRRKR